MSSKITSVFKLLAVNRPGTPAFDECARIKPDLYSLQFPERKEKKRNTKYRQYKYLLLHANIIIMSVKWFNYTKFMFVYDTKA